MIYEQGLEESFSNDSQILTTHKYILLIYPKNSHLYTKLVD
jgi:hypothetical protein